MANSSAMALLQVKIKQFHNYMNFVMAFLKKRKPSNCVKEMISNVQDVLSNQEKLKRIKYRINYEKYKLKKTELILAQNQDHVFLNGRKLNQTR